MNNRIKIFMCCHKEYGIIPPLAVPFQGGRAINTPIKGIDGDNTGDNISEKNKEYCELTVQYHAWKNSDLDAYGFCHYRRFFCFNPKIKKPYLVFGKMSRKQQSEYLGTENDIIKAVSENDIIVTKSELLESDIRTYYANAKNHFAEDLELFEQIITEKRPELVPFMNEYLSQNREYFCNMFIMKKTVFAEYCEILFPVLEEFDKRKTLHGNFQADRTDGYLAERFVGIYLAYAKSKNAKVLEVPRIDVECTLKKRIIYSLFPPESRIRFFMKNKRQSQQ